MALPLILAGLQVAGGVAGAVQGNQNRQKAKGEIGRAYELGQKRLALRQGDVRQGTAESLVARGLAQGGNVRLGRAVQPLNTRERETVARQNATYSSVAKQMGIPTNRAQPIPAAVAPVSVRAARDLGGQVTADLAREQQLEQNAMKQQRDSALAGADAAATGALVGGIGQAVAGGIQGYQSGQMFNSFNGINPVDPLSTPQWSRPAVDSLNIYSQRG